MVDSRGGALRWLVALVVGLALGCAGSPRPVAGPSPGASPHQPFSHAALDAVLTRYVDDEGRVDYPALAADRADLDRYVAELARVSPDSHPERFPTRDERLAYWINAYNAWVLVKVLEHLPIDSVEQVPRPLWAFFLPRLAGFFLFQPIELGGETTNLYALENRVVRGRFDEPRIHFALNCASASCPKLPHHAFMAASLEDELEREARRFAAEERNVRVDPEAGRIELSAIFDWYEGDYTGWLERRRPGGEATLLAYVETLLDEEKAAALRECTECAVRVLPYDWSLNDRRLVR